MASIRVSLKTWLCETLGKYHACVPCGFLGALSRVLKLPVWEWVGPGPGRVGPQW